MGRDFWYYLEKETFLPRKEVSSTQQDDNSDDDNYSWGWSPTAIPREEHELYFSVSRRNDWIPSDMDGDNPWTMNNLIEKIVELKANLKNTNRDRDREDIIEAIKVFSALIGAMGDFSVIYPHYG